MERTSKEILTTDMISSQRLNSKRRGHTAPPYTSLQFREWVFAQPNFNQLYDDWVASGYETMMKPSCDRNDSTLPYSFDNITLMTWKQNHENNVVDVRRGYVYQVASGSWRAQVKIDGKPFHIKQSKNKDVALKALEEWRKKNN